MRVVSLALLVVLQAGMVFGGAAWAQQSNLFGFGSSDVSSPVPGAPAVPGGASDVTGEAEKAVTGMQGLVNVLQQRR